MFSFLAVIGRFIKRLFLAVKFACLDYDASLKRTKTPTQRLVIWTVVLVCVVVLVIFLLSILGDIFGRMTGIFE